jgi:hypothetical protein
MNVNDYYFQSYKKEGEVVMNELFFSSLAFGLFIVCPRMAGMMHVINKHSKASILRTVIVGTLLSIPLLLGMVFVFSHCGIWGAVLICVGTDFAATFIMKEISKKAALETLVIALFVIIGVKIAPIISTLITG